MVLLVTAVPLLAGCGGRTTSDRDLVLVEYADLVKMQAEAEQLAIVDVRPAERFAEGHIPGAVNIRLAEMQRDDPRLSEATPIVVYGRDWQDPRGPAGAKELIRLGYGQVYDFRGGLELWEARGGAVVQE